MALQHIGIDWCIGAQMAQVGDHGRADKGFEWHIVEAGAVGQLMLAERQCGCRCDCQ
jgi:hypothetical protein